MGDVGSFTRIEFHRSKTGIMEDLVQKNNIKAQKWTYSNAGAVIPKLRNGAVKTNRLIQTNTEDPHVSMKIEGKGNAYPNYRKSSRTRSKVNVGIKIKTHNGKNVRRMHLWKINKSISSSSKDQSQQKRIHSNLSCRQKRVLVKERMDYRRKNGLLYRQKSF